MLGHFFNLFCSTAGKWHALGTIAILTLQNVVV